MTEAQRKKQDQFIVRLPDGMRDRIKAAAEASNRSMNAEIVATLEEKYPAPAEDPQLAKLLARQGDLFDRIMDEEDPAAKKALTNEFLALRKRVEEIIEVHSLAEFFAHHEGYATQEAPEKKPPFADDT